MPGHDHCCVPACTNRKNKCPGLSFHAFPKDDQLRRRWIAAIKRDEGRFFAIGSDTRVCSAHFTAEDYFAQCGPEVLSEGQDRRRPCLKRDAVPSIFSFRPRRVLHQASGGKMLLKDMRSLRPKLSYQNLAH